jgi:hypothetical protein
MVKIVMGGSKPIGVGMQRQGNDMSNPNEEISSLNRRIKILEERNANIRNKFQVTEQNMIQKNKNFFTDIKSLNLELTEVKKDINEIKDKMSTLIKELEAFARKDQIDILRKYIDLWSPMKFVSRNEVEDIIREIIADMNKKQ